MVRTIMTSFLALAGVAASPGSSHSDATRAPAVSGDYAYTFRTTNSDKDNTSGTVHVSGDRVRIDIDHRKPGDDEYMIVTDGGTNIYSVHPSKMEIDQINTVKLEHIIGTSLRAVSPVVKFRVLNAHIATAKLGAGDVILGRATQHVRITESYDVSIRAMGFDAGTEHNVVTTDYWFVPGLDLGHNPLLSLLASAGSAMSQGDREYVDTREQATDAAVTGTPLKTVTTTHVEKKDEDAKTTTRTTEITTLEQRAQAASLFELPKGYKMKSGGSFSM